MKTSELIRDIQEHVETLNEYDHPLCIKERLAEVCERLELADKYKLTLGMIRRHMEIVSPSGCKFSTVWVIANTALKEGEVSDE